MFAISSVVHKDELDEHVNKQLAQVFPFARHLLMSANRGHICCLELLAFEISLKATVKSLFTNESRTFWMIGLKKSLNGKPEVHWCSKIIKNKLPQKELRIQQEFS